MYTGRANPNYTTSAKAANTAFTTASSNTFTVSSVSSSHQTMETSDTFIYFDAMQCAAYVLEQLNSEEEQNLYYIIDHMIPIHEQNFALQQLESSQYIQTPQSMLNINNSIQSAENIARQPQVMIDSKNHSQQLQRESNNSCMLSVTKFWAQTVRKPLDKLAPPPSSTPLNRPMYRLPFPENRATLLNDLGITEEQQLIFLADLKAAYNSPTEKDDAINRAKYLALVLLLEGNSSYDIADKCSEYLRSTGRMMALFSHNIMLMFEYYCHGGTTLVRGFPASGGNAYPAELMKVAANMYIDDPFIYYSKIEQELVEFTKNRDYGKGVNVVPHNTTIKSFLERCGLKPSGSERIFTN